MATETTSDLRGFIDQVETQAAAKPRAKKFTVAREGALAAAMMVKGKLESSSLGGKNGKGKTGRPITKPDDPAAKANRERVRKHRANKSK